MAYETKPSFGKPMMGRPGMNKPVPVGGKHPAGDENDSYLKPGQPDLDDARPGMNKPVPVGGKPQLGGGIPRPSFTGGMNKPVPMGGKPGGAPRPNNPMLDAMKRRLQGQ